MSRVRDSLSGGQLFSIGDRVGMPYSTINSVHPFGFVSPSSPSRNICALHPCEVLSPPLAPARVNMLTITHWFAWRARSSGVGFWPETGETSAPAFMSSFTILTCPLLAAQCKGAHLTLVLIDGLVPHLSIILTYSSSPFAAAS